MFLVFYEFCVIFLKTIYINFIFILLFVELLLNSFYNFQIYAFLSWHTFLCLLIVYLHYHHLLINYKFLLLIQQILWRFFNLIHLSLMQLLIYFFPSAMFFLVHNLKYQILFQHLLQCPYKYQMSLFIQSNCFFLF